MDTWDDGDKFNDGDASDGCDASDDNDEFELIQGWWYALDGGDSRDVMSGDEGDGFDWQVCFIPEAARRIVEEVGRRQGSLPEVEMMLSVS